MMDQDADAKEGGRAHVGMLRRPKLNFAANEERALIRKLIDLPNGALPPCHRSSLSIFASSVDLSMNSRSAAAASFVPNGTQKIHMVSS